MLTAILAAAAAAVGESRARANTTSRLSGVAELALNDDGDWLTNGRERAGPGSSTVGRPPHRGRPALGRRRGEDGAQRGAGREGVWKESPAGRYRAPFIAAGAMAAAGTRAKQRRRRE